MFTDDPCSILAADSTIKVWSLPHGTLSHTFGGIHTLNGLTGTVLSLKINAEATKLYSGSEDQTVKVWLMTEARCLQSIPAHAGYVTTAPLLDCIILHPVVFCS